MIDGNLKDTISRHKDKYKDLLNLILNSQTHSNKTYKEKIFKPKGVGIQIVEEQCVELYFYVYKLNTMGYLNYTPNLQVLNELPRSITSDFSMIEYTKNYINFLKIADFSASKKSTLELKMDVFIALFSHNYCDNNIEFFITKFINDPFVYEKDQKIFLCDLAMLIYQFCYLNKIEKHLKILKQRIVNSKEIKKGLSINYDYKICNDPAIDLIILSSKIKTSIREEAIFLNSCYKIYYDKSLFTGTFLRVFFKRFVSNLLRIESCYILDFLKITFLYNSVLFTMVSDSEVLQIPFKLIKNKAKISQYEDIFTYIEIIFDKCSINPDVYLAMMENLGYLSLIDKTCNKTKILYLIKNIKNINDVLGILNDNQDSFINTQIIINDYRKYYILLSLFKDVSVLFDLLEINIKITKNIKIEFLIHLEKIFICIFRSLIERIDSLVDDSITNNSSIIENIINTKQQILCDGLSSFVILLQRSTKISEGKNKKKKLTPGIKDGSGTGRFIESIRKLELHLNKQRNKMNIDFDITLLKDRSFQIIPSNQTNP